MSKMILAAMMAFGVSAFANDTKPAETMTTPAAEGAAATGTETTGAAAAEGKKMAKAGKDKAEKHGKKEKKAEHGGH